MFNSTGGKATILVADDDEINREFLAEILMREGYSVVRAEDGEQALEAIESKLIDLALLDVVMPGKTGFEVCRAIKSRPEKFFTPILLVTGLTRVDHRIEGITCGADDFLTKPGKQARTACSHTLPAPLEGVHGRTGKCGDGALQSGFEHRGQRSIYKGSL